MRVLIIFLLIFIKSQAQKDASYKYRTVTGEFKVLEIKYSKDNYFTIYLQELSNGVLYKVVSLDDPKTNILTPKLHKNRVYHLNLKSYFNFSKKIGNIYYPISSSNYCNCIGIDNNVEICIENKKNMDKDVFFISELKGLYLDYNDN